MAEEVGFEPTDGHPSPVFKTGAFSRSATPPQQCGEYYHADPACKSPLGLIAGKLREMTEKSGKAGTTSAF